MFRRKDSETYYSFNTSPIASSGTQPSTPSSSPGASSVSSFTPRSMELFTYVQPAGPLGRWIGRCLRLRVERFHCVVASGKVSAKVSSDSSSPPSDPDRDMKASSVSSLQVRRVEVETDSLMPDYEVLVQRQQQAPPSTSSQRKFWLGRRETEATSTLGLANPASPPSDHNDAPVGSSVSSGYGQWNPLTFWASAPSAADQPARKSWNTYPVRVALTYNEIHKIRRRLFSPMVLHVERYPQAVWEWTSEDADSLQGDLYMHGATHSIQCHKFYEDEEASTIASIGGGGLQHLHRLSHVRCVVPLEPFSITRPSLWMGLFTTRPEVEVEVSLNY